MLRIAMLLASDGRATGGMEKQVALQANFLQRLPSAEIQVLAHPAYAELFDASVAFYPIASRHSRHHPKLLWNITRLLKNISPDIVHAHGDKAATLLSHVRLVIPQTTRVATVHGTKRPQAALARMHHLLAVSEGVREALRPLEAGVIGNAIEAYGGPPLDKQALYRQFDLRQDWPLLIAAGRLAEVKRYDQLMQAMQDLPANLLIFGDGPMKGILQALERPHIRLAGHTDSVQAAFASADAVVISSSREGMSLSMLEALQTGTPVISTPVSGAVGLLPESCLLNQGQDLATQLGDKLNRLAQLRAASANAIAQVQHDCRPEQVVARLLNVYHCALKNKADCHAHK